MEPCLPLNTSYSGISKIKSEAKRACTFAVELDGEIFPKELKEKVKSVLDEVYPTIELKAYCT